MIPANNFEEAHQPSLTLEVTFNRRCGCGGRREEKSFNEALIYVRLPRGGARAILHRHHHQQMCGEAAALPKNNSHDNDS